MNDQDEADVDDGPINPELGDSLTAQTLRRVPLLPLLPDSNQNLLKYVLPPEFGQPFDHLRFRNDHVGNSSVYTPPTDKFTPFKLPGTFLYGGVIFPAFGTFIAESIHRLWPVFTDPACRDLPILFHSTGPGLAGEMALPRWMEQIFALLGIESSRVILIDRPMTARTLVVPMQGSMLGMGSVSADYDKVFPPRREGRDDARPRSGHLYVSRSKYLYSGSYLGETLVEDILRESGRFEILHPQDHPVADVVDKLESCESAVFAEGSAIHILELCRTPPPKTFVVMRRDMQAWRKFFELMVAKRSPQVELHQVRDRLASLTWSAKSEGAADNKAAAVHDIAALLDSISAFCGIVLRKPSEREIRTAQGLSLLNLIMDERSMRASTPLDIIGSAIRVLQMQAAQLDILPFDLPDQAATLAGALPAEANAKKSPKPKRPKDEDDDGVPKPRRLKPAR